MYFKDNVDGDIKSRLVWIVTFTARTEFTEEIQKKVTSSLSYFDDITFEKQKLTIKEDEITWFLKNTRKPGEDFQPDLTPVYEHVNEIKNKDITG